MESESLRVRGGTSPKQPSSNMLCVFEGVNLRLSF